MANVGGIYILLIMSLHSNVALPDPSSSRSASCISQIDALVAETMTSPFAYLFYNGDVNNQVIKMPRTVIAPPQQH